METVYTKNNKKGITLVEVVVALAIITIISVVAFSVINYALLQQKKLERNQLEVLFKPTLK